MQKKKITERNDKKQNTCCLLTSLNDKTGKGTFMGLVPRQQNLLLECRCSLGDNDAVQELPELIALGSHQVNETLYALLIQIQAEERKTHAQARAQRLGNSTYQLPS